MKSPFVTVMLQSTVVSSLSSSYSMMEELSKVCGCDAFPLALDFMRRCMRFNPEERCSAQSALEHPFVIAYNNSQSYAPDFKGVFDVRKLDVMCVEINVSRIVMLCTHCLGYYIDAVCYFTYDVI